MPSRKFVAPRSCSFARSGRTNATSAPLVLQHRDLGNFGRAAINRLQIFRGHLLATAQNEDFLGPAGDEQETVAVDKAQIPGPVPSIGRERLPVGLRIVEIALGDRAAVQLYLAYPLFVGVGDPHLAIGEGPPDTARSPRLRPVSGEQRGGLREPVSGEHGPTESLEPLLGLLLQPRSARNQQPQVRGDPPSNRGE